MPVQSTPVPAIEQIEGEEWRDIEAATGYQISNSGRVRSRRPRGGRGPLPKEWRVRKIASLPTGYRFVFIRFDDSRLASKYIHSLVLAAFVGPRPDGMECRHLNGDKTDNRLANLAWGTHVENESDKLLHGTLVRGERHPAARLSSAEVEDIKRRRLAGESRESLATRFRICPIHVWQICTGRRRAHG